MTQNNIKNEDTRTVDGFGDEWTRFDQSTLSDHIRESIFSDYFNICPWDILPEGAKGADIGCGSGRWAKVVAPRVGHLIALDASHEALQVAASNLSTDTNVTFTHASIGQLPIEDASLDFAYSLGVLHHVPHTEDAIKESVRKLRPGAPFLVYLYYLFDNQPTWYRSIWYVSNLLRLLISALSNALRYRASQVLAYSIYWPFARVAYVLNKLRICPDA